MVRTDTRERILDEAEQLMGARGYSGFSYQDISKPLGIRNAAVHYHFPTKADLGVAVIQRYRDMLAAAWKDFRAGRTTPQQQFDGYLKIFTHEAVSNRTLCPMGVLTADYFNLPDPMLEAGAKLKREVLEWLTEILAAGRECEEFRFEGGPEQKALMIMATLQGARQMARMIGNDAMLSIITRLREDLVIDAGEQAA
jgi:TetR/AcrR family transcriptional repressor of nem operon